MTREEAIKIIYKYTLLDAAYPQKDIEAFEFALKALEQEPCEGVIRRKDEIEESIEGLADMLDLASKASLTPEENIDINLSAITHQLADISLTLAIIADKLGGESEG